MAYVVLAITALATCSAFMVGSRFNAKSEDRTVAANIARLKMEEIKNTHYLSIVNEHPAGETLFEQESQQPPYWALNAAGEWTPALPEGKYEITYPGLDFSAGVVPDPLTVMVTVTWLNDDTGASPGENTCSVSLKTIFSVAPAKMLIK